MTIVYCLGPGGTERSAQNCAIAFHEHGHEVAVLAYQGGGVRAETLQAAGIPVFVGGTTEQELHEATNHACAWRPEIIHLHTTGRQTPVESAILRHVKVAMSRRIPVIATKHFAWADRSNDRGLVDVHMQLSRWCMWKWRQWSRGLQPQPLGAVVPHMIQHDAFYPASAAVAAEFRAEHAIPSDAFVFGRVGQPIAAKWSQVCFQAFASIASSDPRIWFLVVGAPEEYRRIIDRLPADVRNRIVWIDFLHGDEKIRACYAALDCFLHSAMIGESFGMVLAEAMLCRCPVITLSTPTRDNSQLEIVGHERGGLVVSDQRTMAYAMQLLIHDKELRDRLAEQGRDWCLQHYDPGRITKIMLHIAELALAHGDRDALQATLENDPLIDTCPSWAAIRSVLRESYGRPSLRDYLVMHAVHHPLIYGGWRSLRELTRAS